jgi:hypothetical protein
MTYTYNEYLHDLSSSIGYKYLDITAQISDPLTGRLDQQYTNEDVLDQLHLSSKKLYPVYMDALRKVLAGGTVASMRRGEGRFDGMAVLKAYRAMHGENLTEKEKATTRRVYRGETILLSLGLVVGLIYSFL